LTFTSYGREMKKRVLNDFHIVEMKEMQNIRNDAEQIAV
jgi:hypothetical protein